VERALASSDRETFVNFWQIPVSAVIFSSHSISMVQENNFAHWQYVRTELMHEYWKRPPLSPPLNLLWLVYKGLKRCRPQCALVKCMAVKEREYDDYEGNSLCVEILSRCFVNASAMAVYCAVPSLGVRGNC